MSLGERIRERREHRGLTQTGVGQHFGITREAVQQWEAGTSAPSRKRLPTLAVLLKCSVQWLLTGEGAPSSISADISAVVEMLPERDQLTVKSLAENLAQRLVESSPVLANGPPVEPIPAAPKRRRTPARNKPAPAGRPAKKGQ